jgi:hypothetical protein
MEKTMDQILEERGSSTFWLLMYYCQQQNMQMTQGDKRIVMSRTTVDVDIISSEKVDLSRYTNGGMLDTTDIDAGLLLLQGHDPKILPTVQCFNSHSLDLLKRNRFPDILPGKELLLFNLFQGAHFYEVAFSVRAKTFFVFDSIPQTTIEIYQEGAVGQLATVLGCVNGSYNVQLVEGPVQRPGSNDCALFSIVAQHLLSTLPFNELVTMDCATWKMSVNPSNWWSTERISELRPTLLLHLQKQALVLPPPPSVQRDDDVVTVLNEEGKRPRAEETAQEQSEKRANNNKEEDGEVVVEFN